MIIDENGELAHYGVKGMRWGVRKQNRAGNLVKVGSTKARGEKSKPGEYARATYEVLQNPRSIGAAVKNLSIKQAALEKGQRIQARVAARQQGELSVGGKLAYYSNFRVQDLTPTKRSPSDTRSARGASVAGALINAAAIPVGTISGTAVAIPGAAVSAVGLGVSKINSKRKSNR